MYAVLEHGKPHVHVMYGEKLSVYEVETSKVLHSNLPKHIEKQAWNIIAVYKNELLEERDNLMKGEPFLHLTIPDNEKI